MFGSWARGMLLAAALLMLGGLGVGPAAAQESPQISVVLVTKPGFSPSWQREWTRLFTELKVDRLQIRPDSGSEQPMVQQMGTDASPRYRVIGVLDPNNMLVVPGGRFRSGDRQGIGEWLNKVRVGGQAAAEGAPPLPFKLSREQLTTLQKELSKPALVKTAELKPREAIDKIAAGTGLPLAIDKDVAERLGKAEGFGDDLYAVSSGTALACMLRPQGMVLVPTRDANRKLQLSVVPSKGVDEAWPVGWKPEKPDTELVPDMFENLNVEIDDISLKEVLEVIGQRLKLPVLYDHNALAKYDIDPAKINIRYPATRTMYALALQKMLRYGHMKYELRVDEAEQPFMWITTTLP